MAKIYNSNLIKELIEGGKLQINSDFIPNQLAEKIVPVMEVNPALLRKTNLIKAATLTNNTTQTVWTTDTIKDTYITSVCLAFIKDATATTTDIRANLTPLNQAEISVIRIPSITLTAHSGEVSITFPHPILLEKGVAQRISSGTNVGNILISAVYFGYTVENTTA